jgi:hypothetical protein
MTKTIEDALSSESCVDDQVYDDHWQRRGDVYSLTLITARYHRKRQRFFDLLTKLTQASTVGLGASLLGSAVKEHLPLVASAISGLGLLALVFGYGDRKQAHKELADSVALLTARIEDIPVSKVTDDLLCQWTGEMARLTGREPPQLYALTTMCEHEQAVSEGHPNHIPLPPWYQRWLADWISFGPSLGSGSSDGVIGLNSPITWKVAALIIFSLFASVALTFYMSSK